MKNLIKIMICFSLIYTPFFSMSANAANVGGWNLSNPIAQGASTVYDATKKILINGKDFIKKSSVTISPTASQVSKVLARGAAGYALSIAVEQLIGGVDWVLDPANNRIIYYPQVDPELPTSPMVWVWSKIIGSSASSVCNQILSYDQSQNPSYNSIKTKLTMNSATVATCYLYDKDDRMKNLYTFSYQVNPNYDPQAQEEEKEKYLPLEVVAQKVISNAESGDPNAQVATTAVAADIVAESEKDDTKARPIVTQAEANSQTSPMDETGTRPQTQAESNTAQGTQTQNPANPAQTDLALEFPVFCNWAPTICEAAQVVISFPQTLTGWWDTANHKADEWVTSISEAYHDFINDDELPNEETKVDITDIPTPELQENAISWGASCPADVSLPISMQGVSSTIVFSWSPWCQLLSIIKPAIVASAYIGAAFIVLGLRT